ncbi:MAG: hypothetical protein ACLFPL_01265 [Candidatus Nanoarchaeia archaeon]
MTTEMITISKDELFSLIKKAVREELNDYEEISIQEQEELEKLHKDSLYEEFDEQDSVEY